MFDRFRNNIENKGLIHRGDVVVIGLSGGPDSLCMLSLLSRLSEAWDLRLVAVHINHKLRGQDSDGDAEYVTSYCESNGLECCVYEADVTAMADEWNMSLEEAGRKIRYDILRKVAEENGGSRIAIGQNRNDQAETILMRVMRGTGLRGLAGIEHMREDLFIRPILIFSRDEIERYCIENGLSPRIDKTNLKPIYTRNRIRLELMPYIRENFNDKIVDTLFRMGEILREDNEYLEIQADEAFKKVASTVEHDQVVLSRENFNGIHIAIRARVLRKALQLVKGNLVDVSAERVKAALSAIEGPVQGKTVEFPGNVWISIDRSEVAVAKGMRADSKNEFEYSLKMGEPLVLEGKGVVVLAEEISRKEAAGLKADRWTVYVDSDKIEKDAVKVRNRRNGDRFRPLGMRGTKKLKDFFIDEKIGRKQRDEVLLLCSGDSIIWVAGYRLSEDFKIGEETEKVLKLTVSQACYEK